MIFLHANTHGRTSVYSLIRRTFAESAQNLTPEKSQGRHKAEHITVTHPFDDHAPSCLTMAFKNEYSCCAPPTLPYISLRLYVYCKLTTTGHCEMLSPGIAFRHLPPNTVRTGYTSEGIDSLSPCSCPPLLPAPSETFGYNYTNKTVETT